MMKLIETVSDLEADDLETELQAKYGYPRMSVAHTSGAIPILIERVTEVVRTPSGVLVFAPTEADSDSFKGAPVLTDDERATLIATKLGISPVDVEIIEEQP